MYVAASCVISFPNVSDPEIIGQLSLSSIKEGKLYQKQVRAVERELELLRRKHEKVEKSRV